MDVTELDAIWKALSDPTRRQVLDLLRAGPRTTGELCAQFPDLSRFGVMKHLSALEAAGLILVRPRGRERWNHLNAVPIQQLYERWITPYEGHWASSLLRLKRAVEGQKGHAAMTTATLPTARIIRIEQEVAIAGRRQQVFDALTRDVAAWWGEPYTGMDETRAIVLEPVVGGQFRHEGPDGEVDLWGTVTGVKAGERLEITGPCGLSSAVLGVIVFELTETGGTTILKLSHEAMGNVTEETQRLYSEGWADLLGTRLKRFVETGDRMGIAR